MKRFLELVAIAAVFGSLMLFNRYAADLGQTASESVSAYFVQRAIMAAWLAVAGFLVELPRVFTTLIEPGSRLRFDWFVLLVYGLPALVLALLPWMITTFNLPVPSLLIVPNALPAEVLGGFIVGLAAGKAFVKEEYRVF